MSEALFRRGARTAVDLRAHFHRQEPDATLEKARRVGDPSMGGAFAQSERTPLVGTPIVLHLQAASAWDPPEPSDEVRCGSDGVGAHDLARGFGVAFRALAPSQAAAPHELLASMRFRDGGPAR